MTLRWLKIEVDTPEKPEVLAVAAALDLDPDVVFAKCFRLWRWADRHCENGDAPGVTAAYLDAQVGAPGFAKALAKVGWLHLTPRGISIPEFHRHMGQGAKRRALTANRMAASRAKKRDAPSVTDASPELELELELYKKNTPLPPFDSEPFREAWERWVRFRGEIKHPLTPSMITGQFKKLAKWSEAVAVATIEESIANGWQGLFPEKINGRTQPGGSVGSASRVAAPPGKYDHVGIVVRTDPPPAVGGVASSAPLGGLPFPPPNRPGLAPGDPEGGGR